MDKEYTIGKQPCQNFTPNEEENWWGHSEHICPHCAKKRVFCLNCMNDHHEDGWEECWKLQKEKNN